MILRTAALLAAACFCLLAFAAAAEAAPTVTLGSVPAQNSTSGTFTFEADGPALRLECSLDGSQVSTCTSPLPVSGLASGPHTFGVRAIGLDNSVGDPTFYAWTIDLVRPNPPVLASPPDNLLTRFASPTFSGTAEPLARVLLNDGSTQIASIEVDGSGNWSFTPPLPLADGTHLWRARTLDPAGNRSDFTATRTLRIDTVAPEAPVISLPTEGAHVNTRTPIFTGTAEPQVTIAVSEGATRLCSTASAPSGEWSCPSGVQLDDGSHALEIVARDGAGNESPAAGRNFEVDATPPPAPTILSPSDGLVTTAGVLTVSGTASPLARVKVFTGSDEMAEVTAELDGSWSVTFDPVPEDDYVFTAREVDDFANRSSPSNVIHARVDRTAPLASFQTHPAAKSNQSDAAFTFASGEPGSTFECALDSDDWQPCDASVTFPGLAEGTHTLKIRATDAAGNTGIPSSFTWQIDVTPPAVPAVESPADGATVTNARPTISGHADPGVNVEVFIGSTSLGTAPAATIGGAWALTPGSPLPQGVLQVSARAIDSAGNASARSANRQLRVDSIAPSTTIIGSTSSPSNAQTFSVAFVTDDVLAGVSCSLDNAAFLPCSSPYTSPVVSEASHTLRLRASDPAGNVESPVKSVTVVVDRTAPVVQSSLVTGSAGADGIPAFLIASDDNAATGRCKLDNGAFVACSGNFRPAGANAGVHALTIRFTDAAGNSADQVIAFNVVPAPTQPNNPDNPYVPPTTEPVCDVLGSAGKTTGRLTLRSLGGRQRNLSVSASVSSAALVRVDLSSGGRVFGSYPFALRAGSNKLAIKLKSSIAAGRQFEVAARFYTVKREFGTARLGGSASASGYARTAGAQSRLETVCPEVGGASSKAKLSVSGAAAAKSLTVTARGRQPALISLRVYRAGGSVPVANSLLAIAPKPASQKMSLIRGVKLARGGYRFEFEALGAGGVASKGRGAFLVR